MPSDKSLLLWHNTLGNTTTMENNSNYEYFSGRTLSQLDYLEEKLDFRLINKTLEFGAGNGELSSALKQKYNIETTAIDVSEESIDFLKKNHFIDRAERFIPEGVSYDLIIYSHILHLTNNLPEHLNKIENSLLNSGGYLFIETPNITNEYFENVDEDAPYIWFLNKKVIEYIVVRGLFSTCDVSYFGPTWKDFKKNGHEKHYCFSNSDNAIFMRSVLKK